MHPVLLERFQKSCCQMIGKMVLNHLLMLMYHIHSKLFVTLKFNNEAKPFLIDIVERTFVSTLIVFILVKFGAKLQESVDGYSLIRGQHTLP